MSEILALVVLGIMCVVSLMFAFIFTFEGWMIWSIGSLVLSVISAVAFMLQLTKIEEDI